MADDQTNPLPSSLGISSNYVFKALEPVRILTEHEIDETLSKIDRLLAEDSFMKLTDWSLRISEWGIELVSAPLEHWLQSDDFSGYLHEFEEKDTLEWFRSVVADSRHSLGRMLVGYVMRDAGYGMTEYPDDFEHALMRRPVRPPPCLDFDATLWEMDQLEASTTTSPDSP